MNHCGIADLALSQADTQANLQSFTQRNESSRDSLIPESQTLIDVKFYALGIILLYMHVH